MKIYDIKLKKVSKKLIKVLEELAKLNEEEIESWRKFNLPIRQWANGNQIHPHQIF